MTVDHIEPIIRYTYAGPGDYDFPFYAFDKDEIEVAFTDDQGLVTNLVEGVDYTVTLNTSTIGGHCNIIYVAAAGTIDIRRILPMTQDSEWENNNPLDVELIETSFDRLTMMLQQMDVNVSYGNVTTNWRGDWVSAYPYVVKDLIRGPNGNLYTCLVAHTSGSVFTDDLASGLWQLVVDVESVEQARILAEAAAAAAAISELNAKTSEIAAASSETQAGISEVNSGVNAQDASNCAQDAYDSFIWAAILADESKNWANYPEDSPVPESLSPPEYSAYHWMKKAQVIAGGGVTSISGASPITVDNTDPQAPIIGVDGSPAGGTTGQVLKKASNADYDNTWEDESTSGGQVDSIVAGLDIAVDNTDPVNPIVSYNGTYGRLTPPAGVLVTKEIFGLEVAYNSTAAIDIKAGTCWDSLNTTPLTLAGDVVGLTVPGLIADTVYSVFLTDLGDIQFDTDETGANLLAGAVSQLRWVGFIGTNAAAEIRLFATTGDYMSFGKVSESLVVLLTTLYSTVDYSSRLPVSRIEAISHGVHLASGTNNGHVVASLDGINTEWYIGFSRPRLDDEFDAWGEENNIGHSLFPFVAHRQIRVTGGTPIWLAVQSVRMRR